jgi:hypothetical protein
VSVINGGTRWIALDGAVNARAVVPGVLLRSDNLQGLSERDVRVLIEEHAVELVLDLRTDVEVALEGPGPLTTEPSVRIEHRSLLPDSGGSTDLDAETVRPWPEADGQQTPHEPPVVRGYMSYLRSRPDSIVASVRAIAGAERSVLVHCAAGKDRTGVVVALALDAAGVDRGTIIGDYLATGERIEAILTRLLSSRTYRGELEGTDPQTHAPAAESMERLLGLVDQGYGGSAAWLSAHGLGEGDLGRLRRRLASAGASSGPRSSC